MRGTLNIWRVVMAVVAVAMLTSCSLNKRVVSKVEEAYDPKHPQEESYTYDIGTPQGRVIAEANTWMGTPYKYGAAEKGVATDCSGMVMSVYLSAVNIKLPRRSVDMSEYCRPVKAKDVKQSDLVFFATGSDTLRVSHVGIMVDKDRFIHASSSRGVTISHISSPYYTKRLRGYGRVPGM